MSEVSGREFHLGDVLTVTTGRLVAPDGVAALYGLLDYMTGDELFTHQLPRVAYECAPELLLQHPDLADVQVPAEFPAPAEESVAAWLAEQVARFGEYRAVMPLNPIDHTRVNPVAELKMMKPDADIFVVDL